MSWLSDKIYNLADSREFRDFIDFFKLDFFCYQECLILYNDCFYVLLYLEHQFPFMNFIHYKENKWAEVNRFFVDEKMDYNSLMETVRSADYIDYIGNAKALKQIYYYFEAVRRFHPDVFNCKIEAKYADLFDSFDPQHWGFDKILSRIRTQENLKMTSGQIRRWFGGQD